MSPVFGPADALLSRQFKVSTSPFWRDDNPEEYVGQEARQTARERQDQEEKAEPPWTDAEKGAQAAANAKYNSVLPPQFIIVRHRRVSSARIVSFS